MPVGRNRVNDGAKATRLISVSWPHQTPARVDNFSSGRIDAPQTPMIVWNCGQCRHLGCVYSRNRDAWYHLWRRSSACLLDFVQGPKNQCRHASPDKPFARGIKSDELAASELGFHCARGRVEDIACAVAHPIAHAILGVVEKGEVPKPIAHPRFVVRCFGQFEFAENFPGIDIDHTHWIIQPRAHDRLAVRRNGHVGVVWGRMRFVNQLAGLEIPYVDNTISTARSQPGSIPGQNQPLDVVVFTRRQIADLGSRGEVPHGDQTIKIVCVECLPVTRDTHGQGCVRARKPCDLPGDRYSVALP